MSQSLGNLRVEDRKSLFLQATLHFIDGFCSIKLRNISPTGALIEARRLPRGGTPVEIRRGPLTAMGTIIWRRGGKAGIEFLAQTEARRWIPKAAGQGSVEPAFQVFKGAPASAFAKPSPCSMVTTQDMEAVALLLDDLADTFANDAGVLFHYAAKLQALDIASQTLRRLAADARVRRP